MPFNNRGLMVQQEDAGPANRPFLNSTGRVRFPVSPLFKTTRSRGPAAKTPGLHPGNDGSSPSGIIEKDEGRRRKDEKTAPIDRCFIPHPSSFRLHPLVGSVGNWQTTLA